jgi:hypothetical protein
MKRAELIKRLEERDKTAGIGSLMLAGLAAASPALVMSARGINSWIKSRREENAWGDALKKNPLLGARRGLRQEFQQFYVDAPSAADRFISHYL